MVILANSPVRYTYILSIIHLEARGGYVNFFLGQEGGRVRSRKSPSFHILVYRIYPFSPKMRSFGQKLELKKVICAKKSS